MTSDSITKLSIDQLYVGMTESISKVITSEDVRKFSELSGDTNPIHLDEKYPVSEVELILRQNGLNVIHGGKNAIRFTPWFLINDDEINLIITILKNTFSKF